MTVCRYFLQGNCRFGDRCRFEHTVPYESNDYNNSSGYDYSYQNRGRQQPSYSNYNQGHGSNFNQSHGSNYNQGHGRQYNDGYAQNPNYSSQRYYKDDRYADPDYYANKYNKNKLSWMSEDYKRNQDQNTPRSDNNRYVNTSTPKSKTSFSFKDTEVHSRTDRPNDLRMNEKNIIDAEIIKEDALSWDLGNQWPFSCYCPTPGKSAFPGFVDLSLEELRLQAYNAKENNSYHLYVQSVEKALLEIKMKRELLKEPSIQLMTIIEKIRKGEDLTRDSVDGVVPSLSNFHQTSVEGMVADEFSTPQNTPAPTFGLQTRPTSFFGSRATPASTFSFKTALETDKSSAPAFSFKTTQETDAGAKSSASSFSFKLPAESGFNPSGLDADIEVYTPMDKISEQDKEQFSAPTFTLGKIPTVPPSQQMCF